MPKWTCLWVIFQFPVWKWDFLCVDRLLIFVFSPFPPPFFYFPSLCPRLSRAAGYDVGAGRAWLEDLSDKWGKMDIFFLLFSFTVHFASIQNTGLSSASSVILILNRSPGCSDPFHPCFCSDPSAHMGNTVTRPQIMSRCLWGSFRFTLRFFSFGSRPVCDRGGRWHIWLISEC